MPEPTRSKYRLFAYNILAVLLCVFVLVVVNTKYLSHDQPCLALFAMLGLSLVFLSKPMFRRRPDDGSKKVYVQHWSGRLTPSKEGFISRVILPQIDIILVQATIVTFGYIFVQSEPFFEKFWVDGTMLGNRAGEETNGDFVVALIGCLLIIEATRRAIGWTLPILCGVFILYGFFGQNMPEWLFQHRGASWEQMSQKAYLQSGTMCVFGIALRVMLKYVFLFVLFGTVLEQTGATAYILRIARRMFKSSSGGPAKVAVLSSGLMGSLSGSAVANTATTGTFTIPLMKSTGFDAESAAGIEAAASSGGALMPPVMGAGAYMMLEIMAEQDPTITYLKIIQAALIPAILYYTALLLTVHFHAKRIGAAVDDMSDETVGDKVGKEADGSPKSSIYQGVVFFGSFVILIAMLLRGFSPFLAVSYSLAGIVILSMFNRHTRLDPFKIFAAFIAAAKSGTALIVAASCVGIILGIVDMSGLGPALPAKVQTLAGESGILALLLLMVSTIILGMGLPSAVCYLLVALTVNTVLSTLDTPPLAAHLFIFYFGMMSMVTPPVALAAYAGAAIAKADVMRSALAAFRFALVGFALPFAFVLRPELLMLTPENAAANPLMICGHVGTTLVAILGLSSSIAGFAFGRISLPVRAVLLIVSLAIFFTRWTGVELIVQLSAVGVILLLLGFNFSLRNRSSSEPAGA